MAQPGGVVEVPFVATSADSCGYTRGVLGFHLGESVVDVSGRLIDHPTAADPIAPCAGNLASSVATFFAYARDSLVDRRVEKADNQNRPINFSLKNRVNTAPIEKVVIQVCRAVAPSGPPVRCGQAIEYRAPVSDTLAMATSASSCVVRTVQPDGKVVTTKEPEGATKTLSNGKTLVCSAAEWTAQVLTRTARIDAVTVKGREVSIDNASFSGAEDISMDEFAGIMRNLAGIESEPVDRGVVAVDDGTDLPDKEIAKLLEDPSSGGPRVLLVVNSPGPADTFQNFRERAGSDGAVHVLARRPWWQRAWRWIVVHVRCGLRPRNCSVRFTW